MYKRIAVGLDGSETGRLALRHAIGLAKQQRARLRLVTVVDEAAWDVAPGQIELWKTRIRAAKRLLGTSEAAARRHGVKAETKLIEMEGFGQRIAELIAQDAERWRADLLVVGTHGRRGISHLILGSVAEGVVRVSSFPVLLIRGVHTGRKQRPRRRVA
jgi:nucleotide-binding universal stress UspA family protein